VTNLSDLSDESSPYLMTRTGALCSRN